MQTKKKRHFYKCLIIKLLYYKNYIFIYVLS